MEEYTKRNFYEHPSISAVIARHLAANHIKPDTSVEARMAKLEEKVAEQGRRLDSLDSRIVRLEQKNSIAPPKKGGGQVQDLTGGKGRQGGLSSQVSGSHFPASTKDMPTSITRTLASEVLETRGGTLRLPESCIEVTVFCQDWPCWVQALTETRGFKCVKVVHSHLEPIGWEQL